MPFNQTIKSICFPCLPLVLFLLSCTVPVNDPYTERPKPKVSATEVVSSFLEALKDGDFETAYDNIHIFSSDREGYVSRLRLLYENYDMKVIDYRILATQLFKTSAIVVAEVRVDYMPPGESERIDATYRNQYDLRIPKNRWKIIRDICIENCSSAPGAEQESREAGEVSREVQ